MEANLEKVDSKLEPCPICWRPYHSNSEDDSAEEPTITACGHIFGSDCIIKWLQENAQSPTCPCCRYQLQFSDCGHTIAAVKLGKTVPTELKAGEKLDDSGKTKKDENHPKMCIECYLRGVDSDDMGKAREEYLVLVKETGQWYEAVPELAPAPAPEPPRVALRYTVTPAGATRLANAPFLLFGDEPIEVQEMDVDDNMVMVDGVEGEETDDETDDDGDELEEMDGEIVEFE